MEPAKVVETLLEVARKIESATDPLNSSVAQKEKEAVEHACMQVGQSWCGSWLGYHSRTYLEDFRRTTGSDFFDRDCGLEPSYTSHTTPGWVVYGNLDVQDMIFKHADCDFDALVKIYETCRDAIGRSKGQLVAVLSALAQGESGGYLAS